ncbi:MAG: hypothetical protein IJ751_08250 [Oscillospiraceae bacterium]|nr:hypothetical protein [Oscillospiraceae bacterium]
MKQWISTLLIIALVLSLAGCAPAVEPGQSAPAASGVETPVEPDTQEEPNPPEKPASVEGAVQFSFTLPAGWRYWAYHQAGDGFGYAFAPEGADYELLLRYAFEPVGLCGTGVTIEDFTTAGGVSGTSFTEDIGGEHWMCLIFDLPTQQGTLYLEGYVPGEDWARNETDLQSMVDSLSLNPETSAVPTAERYSLADGTGSLWAVTWGEQPDPETGNTVLAVSGGVETDAEEMAAFADAAGDFGLSLLHSCWDGQSNLLLSPYSLYAALGMVANGAAGETRAALEQVLGLDVTRLNAVLGGLLSGAEGDEVLAMANRLWLNTAQGLELEPDFQAAMERIYRASLVQEPFSDATVGEINDWVREHTRDRIPELLQKLDGDSALVLVNALSFDALWRDPYSDYQVSDGVFTALDGAEQTVPMMHGTEWGYLECADATGFVKPYQGGQYAFVALLPREGVALETLLDDLDGAGLRALLEQAQDIQVETALPKFHTESGVSLREALEQLGMGGAFDPLRADFSAIAPDLSPLYLSQVIHKTSLTVDEAGTQAAAATWIVLEAGSVMPEPMPEVILDHPFVYLIMDANACAPIFLGVETSVG